MRNTSLAILVAILATLPVRAQLPPPPLEQMKKLDFLVGTWEGTGWMLMGPQGRRDVRALETVQPKLGGAVLLIEGVGRAPASGDAEERIVHNALGIINFDPQTGEFRMRAWRADGRSVDAKVLVQDKGLIWSFESPGAGTIRYTTTINDQNQWHEIGEMSRDGGKTWQQFFEMTLDKKS